MNQNPIRKHIIFHGRVQGVGFRFYAVHKARALGLTGWVRNLYDDTVEMEVQGSSSQIQELIWFLSKQRYIFIERTDEKLIPLIEERDFREL